MPSRPGIFAVSHDTQIHLDPKYQSDGQIYTVNTYNQSGTRLDQTSGGIESGERRLRGMI
ncbi:hypothetical protein PILCRDRAFT_248789 [Piloderma croceum F 1598]|uniref:Uncharacterized protein n=1 Tax=Piloderma croceum (strain F 1598) TaxID=765440 RepID=A0A0C3G8T5_PILCF|nr:hypothetical protein PILCRDRAFT_248789 [Piloderma croceum F 1598]